MREEDEIRAAVIALAEAQAAGEDIADALPHGEALAAAGAAADGEAVDDALDPEQAREEAIAAVLDAARAASRASRLSCPCEWEARGLVPPSMTPEDLEMAVYDALMEFGDPNGSRDAGDVEVPDAGAATSPRRQQAREVRLLLFQRPPRGRIPLQTQSRLSGCGRGWDGAIGEGEAERRG